MAIKLDIEQSGKIELYSYKIALSKVIIDCQDDIKKIDVRLIELKKEEKKNEQ
jgi:hypothetical protein